MKCFKKSCILSTNEDSHGERRSREDLEDFLGGLPTRIPLGVEHDLATTSNGYIENFAVLPLGTDGEWQLVGDVYLDDETQKDNALRGLSISFIAVAERNSEDALGCIYLPFPYYKHADLNERILDTEFPLAVGRWHKKAADPVTSGLIIGFVAITAEIIFGHLYDRYVREFIDAALDRLSSDDFAELSFDYVTNVALPDGSQVKVLLVSEDAYWKVSLSPVPVRAGLVVAFKYLTESDVGTMKPVAQLRLIFRPEENDYIPHMIHFEDGDHLNLPPVGTNG